MEIVVWQNMLSPYGASLQARAGGTELRVRNEIPFYINLDWPIASEGAVCHRLQVEDGVKARVVVGCAKPQVVGARAVDKKFEIVVGKDADVELCWILNGGAGQASRFEVSLDIHEGARLSYLQAAILVPREKVKFEIAARGSYTGTSKIIAVCEDGKNFVEPEGLRGEGERFVYTKEKDAAIFLREIAPALKAFPMEYAVEIECALAEYFGEGKH